MTLDSPEQLPRLKRIGQIVAQTIQVMGQALKPGVTTQALDEIGRAYLDSQGARSAPELVYHFPGATCISVNNEVAHGIPGNRMIQAGDMVNIDVSAELDGFFGDTGYSFIVEPASERQKHVCKVAKKALKNAIAVVKAGIPLNVIGQAIEKTATENGCSIIRNLGSHGVGSGLHEEPFFIPSFYDPADPRRLEEGMVITIEPFLSNGATEATQADDGWTLKTGAQFITAQYEHSLVVTRTGALVLTAA